MLGTRWLFAGNDIVGNNVDCYHRLTDILVECIR
uniref:Uncharacterized protein n=1 Tax=Arundo donax TaxID=35708 RepID=A0A0A9BCA0_ARUDO